MTAKARAAVSIVGLAAAVAFFAATTTAQQVPTEQGHVTHLLNRIGYGPRPGDIERVRSMGYEAYLEQQLHPATIPDPVADAKVSGYQIRRMDYARLLADDRPAAAIAVRRRETPIRKVMLAERVAAGDAVMVETAEPDSTKAIAGALRNPLVSPMLTRQPDRPFDGPIFQTRLLRAVHSERQLLEVMVDFWFNHFNIRVGDPYLLTDWTQQVIRPHAMGKFEDLLVATATHPAMLLYLDNWLSAAPKEVIQERLKSWKPASGENPALAARHLAPYFEQSQGLNENYGRELMELHTLGVDGGYTQQDVQEVAKAFTGWTMTGGRDDGTFQFLPLIHVSGDKTVLGRTIESGGKEEGMEILRMLAHHPSTAHYISFKLARRFIADEPPEAVVEAAAQTFLDTGGDIPSVLRTILTSEEFQASAAYEVKIKKPWEMVISAFRALDADIDPVPNSPTIFLAFSTLRAMGEPFANHEAPDGYPEVGSAWISTNTLFQRLEFAMKLASGEVEGLRVNPKAAAGLFRTLGYDTPSEEQMTEARLLLARRSARSAGTGAMGMMADEEMSRGMSRAEPSTQVAVDAMDDLAVVTALYLGSPRFQKR
jgi:uncharacterized protein (DUF1800 family)